MTNIAIAMLVITRGYLLGLNIGWTTMLDGAHGPIPIATYRYFLTPMIGAAVATWVLCDGFRRSRIYTLQ